MGGQESSTALALAPVRQGLAVAAMVLAWAAAALLAEDGRFPTLGGHTLIAVLLLVPSVATLALLMRRFGTRAALLWFALGAGAIGAALAIALYGLLLVAAGSLVAAALWPSGSGG